MSWNKTGMKRMMAVAMVIGNNNRISASPFSPAQTMSSLLANEFAEASGPMHLSALVEVAQTDADSVYPAYVLNGAGLHKVS